MPTLRSQYSKVFDNANSNQLRLFANKNKLMSSSYYHKALPTTTAACIVSYENETFTSTSMGSLPIPSAISSSVYKFLNNIVATFSPYIMPLDLTRKRQSLYFIMDYDTLDNSKPLMYCGISNDFKRRCTEHLKSSRDAQFYKHCISSHYFIVGFSLDMKDEAPQDLESVCIWYMLESTVVTPMNVLFYDETGGVSLATLYHRFTVGGVSIGNNHAFFLGANLAKELFKITQHDYLQYLLTKISASNSINVSGTHKKEEDIDDKLVFHGISTFPYVVVYLKTENGLVRYEQPYHIQLILLYFLVRSVFEPLPKMVETYLKITNLYSASNENVNNYWKGLHKMYHTFFMDKVSINKLKKKKFRVSKATYKMDGITVSSNETEWKLKFCDVKKQFYLRVKGLPDRVTINNNCKTWEYMKKIGINSANALEDFEKFHKIVYSNDKK